MPKPIALLSVYNKTGIDVFAKQLAELGWDIYASGGTAKALTDASIEVKDVADLIGGTAILGHRVVTLSREISAGLLADKDSSNDLEEMNKLRIPIIDLVCVDLYPLEEAIAKPDATKQDVIQQTDIGGPTMLRSAAKGRRIVVSNIDQRQEVIDWLKSDMPNKEEFIDKLAASAEYEAARYILASAKYLNGTEITGEAHKLNSLTKYGENPWQTPAGLYADNRVNSDPLGLDQFQHVKGIEKSFINITDVDRLLQTVTHIAAVFEKNFSKVPSIAVGVKHGNACGAGVSDNHVDAIKKMIDGDTRAIFGGVVMLNGPITEDVARTLIEYQMPENNKRLLDGVIGSEVDQAALDILSRNKLRVVTNKALSSLSEHSLDQKRRLRPVRGGLLEQPNYTYVLDFSAEYMQFNGELNDQQRKDMALAWAIGSTSNSNTICLVKNGQLIGNGVGQQDRVGAGQLALTRTTNNFPEIADTENEIVITIKIDKTKLSGSSAYSDSFFPFPDGPELLAKAGIKAILTSSGSVGDQKVIETLNSYKVATAMLPDAIGRGFYMH